MSVAALKEEAIRQFAVKVEAADDEQALKIILEFLGGIGTEEKSNINLSRHYDNIKSRYGTVLKKLAE